MTGGLVGDDVLVDLDVVANAEMNRGRGLRGVDSYARELGVDPLDLLRAAGRGAPLTWVDACCGRANALHAARAAWPDRTTLRIIGLDLVDAFTPGEGVDLVVSTIAGWTPPIPADLVTCVHGLHYVGDKLAAIDELASWLAPAGRFIASLDLDQIRRPDGRPLGRPLAAALRTAGFHYDRRRRLISCVGPRARRISREYLGADPAAGPNYTGQPAVDSYYREIAGNSGDV